MVLQMVNWLKKSAGHVERPELTKTAATHPSSGRIEIKMTSMDFGYYYVVVSKSHLRHLFQLSAKSSSYSTVYTQDEDQKGRAR